MSPFLLVLLSYLLGAIPSSQIVARWSGGVDLTRHGSGNLGATNVFRLFGWKAALPVVLADMGKGWIPAALFPAVDGSSVWALSLAYGGAAIVGHVFPIWTGFRGGKGVATSTGVLLAVAPLALLVGVLVWLALVAATRIVSVASMSAALAVALVIWIHPPEGAGVLLPLFGSALAAFVLWAHRDNVRRLLRGEENRFETRRDPDSRKPASGPDAAP